MTSLDEGSKKHHKQKFIQLSSKYYVVDAVGLFLFGFVNLRVRAKLPARVALAPE